MQNSCNQSSLTVRTTVRDEFEFDMGDIISAHAESNRGEDESFAEARQRVSRGYNRERFIAEDNLFDDVYED